MSMLPFAESIGEYAALVFPRQSMPPSLTSGQEPCLYADADGNFIWMTPQGNKNGLVLLGTSTYRVNLTDAKIAVNYVGAVTISLPESFPEGKELVVWDAGGNTGVPGQTITITPSRLQQINSLAKGAPFVLNKADARISLIRVGGRWNAA